MTNAGTNVDQTALGGRRERGEGRMPSLKSEHLIEVLKGGLGINRVRGERAPQAGYWRQSCCGLQGSESGMVRLDTLSRKHLEEGLEM